MGARVTAIALLALACGFGLPGAQPVEASPASRFRDAAPGIAASSGTEVLGDQPWAVLLCRFSDIDDTPQPPSYFEALFSADYPGLGHYWNEVSLGSMGLAGTEVFGWFHMTRTYGSFGFPTQDGMIPWNQVIDSCMRAADPSVWFPNYRGIAVMLNYPSAYAASLGPQPYTVDGRTRRYFTAVVAGGTGDDPCSCPDDYSGWSHIGTVAHEMGHGMGFNHSSGPYGEVYDSHWDVVSNPWPRDSTGSCRVTTPSYGCAPAHTLAHNKADAGWIPRSQVTTVEAGSSAAVVLHPTALPTTGQMLAWVPLPAEEGRATSLSLEVRQRIGWDAALPGEGLVIHDVRPLDRSVGSVDAVVIDPDGNGDPNDEGAIWRPGETYVHPSGVRVNVLGQEGDALLVEIDNPLPDGTANDSRTDAVIVPEPAFKYRQSLAGSTAASEDGLPGCVTEPPAHTVWFRYRPRSAEDVFVSIASDDPSLTVVVTHASTEIACRHGLVDGRSIVRIEPEVDHEYRVMIGSHEPSTTPVTFSVLEPVAASVRMELTKHLRVTGSVSASVDECANTRLVQIQKRTGGRWRHVSVVTSSPTGGFELRVPDQEGTYRALAGAEPIDDSYVCAPARSGTVEHRHITAQRTP